MISSFCMTVLLPSSQDSISNGVMFSVCLPSFSVRLSAQILLLRYLMNGLNNFEETYRNIY